MNKIIGLDVSKNWLDICVYNTRDKPKYHRFNVGTEMFKNRWHIEVLC